MAEVSEQSHSHQTHLLSTELLYLSCDDFGRKGVNSTKGSFYAFVFVCTTLESQRNMTKK